jgi:asparagine synthase (glutamine-hydrolysing)
MERIMSVQFGRWNFEGQPPAPDYIEKANAAIAPYGPESNEFYSKDGVKILYRAFHTTKESRCEKQPCISPSGVVITFDGRLDNRVELISELRNSLTVNSADVAIVAAADEKWGANCLGKLIGDWALSIWNPRDRCVLLAKDPIGTKHLYYSFDDKQLTWSTILDPLVLFAGKTFGICEEYIAGLFAAFPAAHLTPYVGIHAVPPSSSVLIRPGKHIVRKYWDFDPSKKICYRSDVEYEEHFRTVFEKAVQRRLRSDRPILAELSGGMDSSSIVCMADTVIARGAAETPRLDTLSWYDDSDPNLDERPYFVKVEEKRCRTGCHIDLDAQKQTDADSQESLEFGFENDHLTATPVPNSRHFGLSKQYAACMRSHEYRVVLSGIGGDDVTGNEPTPMPELQNLLARARFVTLARQLKAWAAKMKRPRIPLLREAAQGFLPYALCGMPQRSHPPSWFDQGFVSRNRTALGGYPTRMKVFGSLPSFQGNMALLQGIRRVLTFFSLSSEPLRDLRYPYLDRGLLEFLYAIPREQIVRVGERRSLMKRALVDILPAEILHRRQAAFNPQGPTKGVSTGWAHSVEIDQPLVSGFMGFIDSKQLLKALEDVRRNQKVPIGFLIRTLMLESWLRHLAIQGVLTTSMFAKKADSSSSLQANELHATAQSKSSAS